MATCVSDLRPLLDRLYRTSITMRMNPKPACSARRIIRSIPQVHVSRPIAINMWLRSLEKLSSTKNRIICVSSLAEKTINISIPTQSLAHIRRQSDWRINFHYYLFSLFFNRHEISSPLRKYAESDSFIYLCN